MSTDFRPLFRNPHIATVAGNFWKRPGVDAGTSGAQTYYRVDSATTILAFEQIPRGTVRGHLVVLHGLEGSADAGYIQSLSHLAVNQNFSIHRLNFRTCGGTEALCETMYHSGLTSDVAFIVQEIAKRTSAPLFLIGFSLGGNVAVKLTGEYGKKSPLAGTVAVSAPIDLAACVKAIDRPSNRIYAYRFLNRLRSRIMRKSKLSPGSYNSEFIDKVHTIWQFDNRFTAPLFGFGTAANYYATQSALNYVDQIDSPTLLISAKDDPLVPFGIYKHPAITANSAVRLISPQHGGHIGFLSRHPPRFWVDDVIMTWIQSLARA